MSDNRKHWRFPDWLRLPDPPKFSCEDGWWRVFKLGTVLDWCYLTNWLLHCSVPAHPLLMQLAEFVEDAAVHTVISIREWADLACYWLGVYRALWRIWGE